MIARILRAPLTRLLVVAIVPAVVLGVFVAALAAADAGTARIPAALVNDDALVQTKNDDGTTTTVAAGRLVVTGLTKPAAADAPAGAGIDWTLTNTKDAAQMLADGDVYAIVTIPKSFSKSISTVSTATPKQADISIRTDDAHGTLVSQIGGVVGDTIASTVGGQITTSVVSGLYGGYATVRSSLLKAADGASSLGDGATSLSSGLSKAADGGDGLASGATSLGDGARGIANGASSLGNGLDTAAAGAQSAADGAKRLSGGVDTYTDGVTKYTKGVDTLLDGVVSGSKTSAAAQSRLASGTGTIAGALRQLAAGDPTLSAQASGTLTQLAGQLDTISGGQSQLAAGSSQLAGSAGIATLRASGPRLSSGGASLDRGVSSLAGGLAKLPAGIRSAASGADRLATGAAQLGSGADRLSTGASQLTDGVRRSATGASKLADGADKLGSGLSDGAKQVPNLTKAQQQQAGKVVANPVDASATRANALSGPGQIVSTLIVPVGLWIGAAALVLLFGAVSRRLLSTGVGTGRLVGGALLRGVVVAVVQAVLIVVVVASTLGVSWGALVPLFLVAVVAGIAFLAIHQLLQALLGAAGTVVSIVLLGVQLVAVGGIYPIQLVSAPFQAISPFLPLTAAVNATTAVLTGASGAAVASGLFSLALWALLAFVLTVAVVARRRTSTALFSATPALT
ncbi:YhgE/Pip family protein [uncultured Amnibacterium sp.]|uniref:YhgE/Pip family protein n=1 Tax=uncultured Amnibacterium sp. TaxID=1631851 RepID=UPI0035C9A057